METLTTGTMESTLEFKSFFLTLFLLHCVMLLSTIQMSTKQILYFGASVPHLDDTPDFNSLCPHEGIQNHFYAA